MTRRERSAVSAVVLLLMLVLVPALLIPDTARAHAFAPALLELRETAPGVVDVRFKQPSVRAAGSSLRPALPASCRATTAPAVVREGTGLVVRQTLACPEGLVDQRVGVAGIAASGADVLLRVELADGRSTQRVLTLDRPSIVVPRRPSALDLGRSYGVLGVEHIAGGADHLLFVLGLVLLVGAGPGRARRLLATVTAFTVGHSVTLALASLELVQVPQAPVEALIAASLFVLAVQLVRGGDGAAEPAGLGRASWMAAGFGLLHGLGFAGALREAGLPQHDVPTALFAFNLGIEVGQLLFVVCVLALAALGAAVLRTVRDEGRRARTRGMLRAVPVHAIGILAVYWMLDRGTAIL